MISKGSQITTRDTDEEGQVVALHPTSRWPYTVRLAGGKTVCYEADLVKEAA